MGRRGIAFAAWAGLTLLGVGCEERPRQWSMTKSEPSASVASAAASSGSVSATVSASASGSGSGSGSGSASASGSTSASASGSAAAGAVPQLHYGNVTLSGTLTEQTFPGPPTYGS